MRNALSILTTSGLVLSATLVACSLNSGDDDDDGGASGGAGTASGGGSVVLNGGASNKGGAGGNHGGSSGNGNTTGGGGDRPPACEIADLPQECGTSSQTADIKTVNMLLVVDKSGSMEDTPGDFVDNKWVSLGSALKGALGGVQDQMNLGLILYPYDPANGDPAQNACTVSSGPEAVNVGIGPGTTTVNQIVRIVEETTPSGGTPTAAALQAAYNYYTTGEGASLPGDKYVLLATDGGPNCNPTNTLCKDNADLCTINLDAQNPDSMVTCAAGRNCCINTATKQVRSDLCLDSMAVVDNIVKLKNVGVTTYVVGIPGTEAYSEYLDQFAEASGQINPDGPEKYYAVSAAGGVAALTQTFKGIVTQLVHSCDIPLNTPPDDINLVTVAIDCMLKGQNEPGAGWSIDAGGTTLTLKGSTCEKIQTSGAKRVDLYYGCRPPL